MKKLLLVLAMLSAASMTSFAKEGEMGDDFFSLYESAYKAVGSPEMRAELKMNESDADMVLDMVNESYIKVRKLELKKQGIYVDLDAAFAKQDTKANREFIVTKLKEIRAINEQIHELAVETKEEVAEHVDMAKLEKM